MSLSRRQFLRASAGSMAAVATPGLTFAETMLQPIADPPRSSPVKQDVVTPRNSIGEVWGVRTPYYQQWPDRVDSRIVEEPERWIQSTCILCRTDAGWMWVSKMVAWSRSADAMSIGSIMDV